MFNVQVKVVLCSPSVWGKWEERNWAVGVTESNHLPPGRTTGQSSCNCIRSCRYGGRGSNGKPALLHPWGQQSQTGLGIPSSSCGEGRGCLGKSSHPSKFQPNWEPCAWNAHRGVLGLGIECPVCPGGRNGKGRGSPPGFLEQNTSTHHNQSTGNQGWGQICGTSTR